MIPDSTLRSLENYRDHGAAPGGFLRKVLENRVLFDVIGHADNENARALKPICIWIYNELEINAWGTAGNVKEWIDKGGQAGRTRLTIIHGGSK